MRHVLPWIALGAGCTTMGSVVDEGVVGDSGEVPPGWQANRSGPTTPPDTGSRLTIDTSAGPFTVPVVDAAGAPLELDAAVGFDADQDGIDELYASDGSQRWRFDPVTAAFVDPAPWVDLAGAPLVPQALAAGWYADTPVFVTSHDTSLRLWDDKTATLSDPVPLARSGPKGKTAGFAATDLALLHLQPTAGLLLGLHRGAVFAEVQPLSMVAYLDPPGLCSGGRPFSASGLVVATPAVPAGPYPQDVIVYSGVQRFTLNDVRCFGDPELLVDDDDQPIRPHFAAAVDFDGDGVDELVWGHP